MAFVISGFPRSNESLGLAQQVGDQDGNTHCAAGKQVKSPLFMLTLPCSNFMYPQIARTSIDRTYSLLKCGESASGGTSIPTRPMPSLKRLL